MEFFIITVCSIYIVGFITFHLCIIVDRIIELTIKEEARKKEAMYTIETDKDFIIFKKDCND